MQPARGKLRIILREKNPGYPKFEIIEEDVKQWVCEIEQTVEHEDGRDEVHVEEEECMQHGNR